MATTTMQDCWSDVKYALNDAKLIAFDGCHKIYLAMDDIEAKWFADNYNEKECSTSLNFTGSPDEMLATIRTWWDESCGLRFISAVSHNEQDPNAGFVTLIPQGAEDEVEVDEDEDDDE